MRLTPLRRTVQICLLLLLFVVPLLNQWGISLVSGTLYSFAIGPLWITDPAIGLHTLFTTRGLDITLLLSLLLPVLLALVCGRGFWGGVCPENNLSGVGGWGGGFLGVALPAEHPLGAGGLGGGSAHPPARLPSGPDAKSALAAPRYYPASRGRPRPAAGQPALSAGDSLGAGGQAHL